MMKAQEIEVNNAEGDGEENIRNANFTEPKVVPFDKVDDEGFRDFLSHRGLAPAPQNNNPSNAFNPMTMRDEPKISSVHDQREFIKPVQPIETTNDEDDDDDVGFDVDELVKKIDAKIAELEEEERREKEAEEKKKKEQEERMKQQAVPIAIPAVNNEVTKPEEKKEERPTKSIDLNDDLDDDDFFDDFFDN